MHRCYEVYPLTVTTTYGHNDVFVLRVPVLSVYNCFTGAILTVTNHVLTRDKQTGSDELIIN